MLASRCPHCQTRFRVTPAQLELRAGLVRCGACREIFNGREHLLGNAEPLEALASTADDADGRMTLIDFGSLRASQPAVTSKMQEELDELSKAIADLQAKPWRDTSRHELAAEPQAATEASASEASAVATPAFIAQARKHRQSAGQWKPLLWLGIPLLLTTLALQLA